MGGDPAAPALLGAREWSRGELAAAAARHAGALVAAGVGAGDRVVIGAPNDHRFVVGYLAVLWCGAVAVPVNPRAPEAELAREAEVVAPAAAIAVDAPALAALAGRLGRPLVDPSGDGLAIDPVDRAPDDPATLLFTAGTGGPPKAAVLTHGSLLANIDQLLAAPGVSIGPGDVGFGVLPFFHVFGLNVGLGAALAAGAALVEVPEFDPAGSLELARRHGVTVIAAVPAVYDAWCSVAAEGSDALATVRVAVSGGATLPPPLAARVQERFGFRLHEGYGLTEASPVVSTTLGVDDPVPLSVGTPLPGVEVRLVDHDGDDVVDGDPGEVWVRGANVFAGYWHDDAATARVLTSDGWLRTGDIGVALDDGTFQLVDRAKDLVIVSGFNVYPAEVEDVLRENAAVSEVAVAGVPDAHTGEAVVAWIVPRPGAVPDTRELDALATRQLSRYKRPTRYEIVEELPRTFIGKLQRRALRELGVQPEPTT